MALLITLFLVLVNIFNAITTNSPKADGLNALQAWVIACIFFIFGKILLCFKLFSFSSFFSSVKSYNLLILIIKRNIKGDCLFMEI